MSSLRPGIAASRPSRAFHHHAAHLLAILALVAGASLPIPTAHAADTPEYVPGRVIVKFKSSARADLRARGVEAEFAREVHATVAAELDLIGAQVWDIGGADVLEVVERWKSDPRIEYIEPDWIVHASRVPNDTRYSELWGMAKIQAPAAWDTTTGTNVLVGVIDTGVDYTHPDLAANMWTNPGEIRGNGIDDDGNGYVDDFHGWDFANNDSLPMDDHNHGTHVAGTIAAVGNNAAGVAGVNWNARIMAIKFLNASGSGTTSAAISCVQYATRMGVRLTNNSWGGGAYSQALYDAIRAARDANQLFVAAAGNFGDSEAEYPARYGLDNIVAVAATDQNDNLASFSNYGAVSVDLGAPGVDILSTFRSGAYGTISGTSMASPHVAGAAALILAFRPAFGAEDVKTILMNTVDPVASMQGRTVTGGRLNLFRAIQAASTWTPLTPPEITLSSASFTSSLAPDANETQVLTIQNAAGAAKLNWSIAAPACAWLTRTPASGSLTAGASQQVQLRIDAFGLEPGAYHCDLDLTSNDSDESAIRIGVDLTVIFLPPAEASISPTDLSLGLPTGESSALQVSVANTAPAGSRNLHWSATREGASAWLTLQNASAATAPGATGNFTATVSATGLSAGTYTDAILVTTSDPDRALVRIPVELRVSAATVYGQKLYAFGTGPDVIHRADLDGSGVSQPFTGTVRPIAGDVDETNRKLYWIDFSAPARILRANLDGTQTQIVLANLASPVTLGVDAVNGHLYFIHYVSGYTYAMKRADLDGGNLVELGQFLTNGATGLTVDAANGKLYWGGNNSGDPVGGIYRSDLDFTNRTRLIAASVVTGLTVDVANGRMYWGESYPRDVFRTASLDGSSPTDLFEGYEAGDIGVDPAGGKIYWTQLLGSYPNFTYDTFRANLDGTQVQSLGIKAYKLALDLSPGAPLVAVGVTTSPPGLAITVDGNAYTSPQTFSWAEGSRHTIAVASPQSPTAGTRHALTAWSDGGAASHVVTVPTSPITYEARFDTEHLLTTSASLAEGGTIEPATGWRAPGPVQVAATTNGGFLFTGFSGDLSGTNNPQTLNLDGPKTVTASFVVDPAVIPSAAATAPDVMVAGAATHELRVEYTDETFIDRATLTDGDVRVTGPNGFSALATLVPAAPNATAGRLESSQGGDLVTVVYAVTPPGGSWDLADAGTYTIEMVADQVFDAEAYRHAVPAGAIGSFTAFPLVAIQVNTSPPGAVFTVDGTPYTAAQTFQWPVTSQHTIATTSPQALADPPVVVTGTNGATSGSAPPEGGETVESAIGGSRLRAGASATESVAPDSGEAVAGFVNSQLVFTGWSDQGAISHSVTTPATSTTFTASFKTQHFLHTIAPVGGLVSPSSGYHDPGPVEIRATPERGYLFDHWSGDFSGTTNPATFALTAPATVIANFVVDPAVIPRAAASASDVTAAGATAHTVTVVYTDDYLVERATLGTGDIQVTGTGGFLVTPAFVSATPSIGAVITATYSFTPPGGAWDLTDAGDYSIVMVASQVSDADPGRTHQVPAGTIGTFAAFPMIEVRFTTSPAGLSYKVDGTTYTNAQTFSWIASTSHVLEVDPLQDHGDGTRHLFEGWNHASGTFTHVAPTEPTTYTASFRLQNRLTTDVSPAGTGSIAPASAWFDAGTPVSIGATPIAGYNFTGFSGSLSGATNPQMLTMNAPASVTAHFARPVVPSVLDVRIASGSNDAEESGSGSVDLSSGDLELVNDGSNQTVGLRFPNLAIPRGATITSAWLQFEADETQSGPMALWVHGQAVDHAPAFTSASRNLSARPRTAARVAWTPPAWLTVGHALDAQRASGLESVIQEIVGRPGWASGNALALFVTGTGHRTAESYEGRAAGAPLLHVEFTIGGDFNRAPVVNAGLDQVITQPDVALLDGTVSDDGLVNPPGTLVTTWQQVSGAGVARFANANSVDTQVSFDVAGTYVLSLTAFDGALGTSDSVRIVVRAPGLLTIERRVSSGSDDAEETASGSALVSNGDLEMTFDGNFQTVGLRFPSIGIPNGATIASAWVQFRADETQDVPTVLTIRGQSGNAAPFSIAPRNVTSRQRTAAAVEWRPDRWLEGQSGTAQRTSDLTLVVQEIVNGSGWASGNALALIVTGFGHRTAESFEGMPAGAALLHVEYGLGTPANQAPRVDAGPLQIVTLPAGAQLDGTATDDGLPTPSAPEVTWTQDDGPATATIENPNAVDTRVTFTLEGVYRFRLTASDGVLSASDTASVVVLPAGTVNVFDARVAVGADDAEESAGGSVSLTSGDLDLVYDSGLQSVGVRFRSVMIPRGAVIERAWIQFQADEARSDSAAITIQGEASDNAPAFTTASRNVSARPRTVESVTWRPEPWLTVGEAGLRQRTIDLAAVIGKIVGRAGWTSGNALAVIFTSTGSGRRIAESFESVPAGAPLLHVEYRTNAALATSTIDLEKPVTPVVAPAGPSAARVVPNPVRGRGAIELSLGRSGIVRAELFDVLGRRVATLVDGQDMAAAVHRIELGRLAPGLYLYRVVAPDRSLQGRVMVLD